MDHAGGLRHISAIIEGDEEESARRGEAGFQPCGFGGAVEECGCDAAEQGPVARQVPADLAASLRPFFIFCLHFRHKALTFT